MVVTIGIVDDETAREDKTPASCRENRLDDKVRDIRLFQLYGISRPPEAVGRRQQQRIAVECRTQRRVPEAVTITSVVKNTSSSDSTTSSCSVHSRPSAEVQAC